MSKEIQLNEGYFSTPQLDLLKDMFFKGCTDDEFKLFVYSCQRTRLDPFMRQIYPVKRWDSTLQKNSMTIQTGIDGYRLMAERTSKYMPGKEPTYNYAPDGSIISATAYVKKLGPDGQWHETSATAFYDEYCQKSKEGRPVSMWAKMPHNQLAKCAEALALRKAFPADLSGIYTQDEMAQGAIDVPCDDILEKDAEPAKKPTLPFDDNDNRPISRMQLNELIEELKACPQDYQEDFLKKANETFQGIANIPIKKFHATLKRIKQNKVPPEEYNVPTDEDLEQTA